MIHTIKTIDYKKAKFNDKEIQDFCKKMGIVTQKDLDAQKKKK